ncbi:hypothetical protein ScPMuIL_016813 [Solemya velum]
MNKTGCLVLILICVMHFNLVFAKHDCADRLGNCLKACKKTQNVDDCKEQCQAVYQRCIRYGKKGKEIRDHKPGRKRGRKWSNPKRALISLGLEATQAAIRRLTSNPRIIKMGTN